MGAGEDWDFYFVTAEGGPASIYLDLALERQGPVAALPWSAYVRVQMNAPREDGLSSSEEFDALAALEDALVAGVAAEGLARYAGRCTIAGRRDFYFFTGDPAAFEVAARAALAPFDRYGGEMGAREDPEWRSYFGFLLPPPPTRRGMLNRRVCHSLEENGDDLTALRPIEHAARFPTEASRDAFARQVEASGFVVESSGEPQEGEYWITVSAAAAPARIDAPVEALHEAARRCGGVYDGWGCEVRGPSTKH